MVYGMLKPACAKAAKQGMDFTFNVGDQVKSSHGNNPDRERFVMPLATIAALLALTAFLPPSQAELFSQYGCQLCQPAAPQAEGGLVIRLGETWFFHIENGQPAGARRAGKDDKARPGELIAALDGEGRGGATLSITNGGEAWYDYSAFIVAKPGHKGNRTSTCTLMGGGRSAFESWPEAIPAIRLADFREVPAGQLRCR